MNRALVLAEWRLARLALRAAQLLVRNRIYPDAVSRAYYAILHSAKAALQTRGVSAESHAAVKRLFGMHLIKTGDFEPEWSAALAEGLDDRLSADYDSERSVSAREARAESRRAAAFLRRVRSFLRTQGLTPTELNG
jgi:uncharacterized protein (UPF0332 family)